MRYQLRMLALHLVPNLNDGRYRHFLTFFVDAVFLLLQIKVLLKLLLYLRVIHFGACRFIKLDLTLIRLISNQQHVPGVC